jgi:hypothetical protein
MRQNVTPLLAEAGNVGSVGPISHRERPGMSVEPGSIEHLTQIISQVVGPSFLLGAVASFISMLFGRTNGVLDRIRTLNGISDDDPDRAILKADMSRLQRRLHLLQLSVLLGICAGVVTTLLIIVAFSAALLGYHHAMGSALLFIVALIFFLASLVVLAREVAISLSEFDHY